MAVSSIVISAYVRLYTAEQLETALGVALADRAAGVTITNVAFDGGGSSGQPISGDPNELIEILEMALRQKNGEADSGPQPLASGVNFRTRRFET